jgi:hypothetical protein
MKRILILITTIVIIQPVWAGTPKYPKLPDKDTVVINFGNNSKIMILVDNKEELKRISEFDINAMLQDLSISVDSMSEDENYLKYEDETGEKYLKDTSIVVGKNNDYDLEQLKESIKEEVKNELKDEGEYDNRKDSRKRKKYQGTKHYFNVELGMNNYMQDGKFPDESNELYSVKPWGSWYVGMNATNRTHAFGPLYFDWGAGISWYNFKFQNTRTRLEKDNIEVNYFEDPTVPNPVKSKLAMTHLNAHLVPVFNFGRSGRKKDIFHWDYYDSGFRIGAGGYIGYRIDSWTKAVWKEENGDKKKDRVKDNYYLNNIRYGVKFIMGYRAFDIFVNYDISELYSEGRGPTLNPFSFGIIL